MKYLINLRNGLDKLIKEENVYLIGEDIQEPYGGAFKVTKGLSEKYPENIIATPMSEQGFTGLGVGMALQGKKVIVEIMFGDFITLAADQMINHAAKFKGLYGENLCMVLRCPSGGYRGYGATHSQSLESMYMGIPGMQVISPSIAHDPSSLLIQSVNSGIPTLFVENKLDYPRELLKEKGRFWKKLQSEDDYPICSIKPLDEKTEVSVIVYGGLVQTALEVMEEFLYEEEINVEVIIPSNLTDLSNLANHITSQNVVVVEEGVSNFGWASEVCCELSASGIYSSKVGAKRSYIPSAKKAEEYVLPTKEDFIKGIWERIHNDRKI